MKTLTLILSLLLLVAIPVLGAEGEGDSDVTDGGGYDQGTPPTTTQFGVGSISESVNLFNGSLSLTMPLCTLKGTAGFEYQLNLGYSAPASPYEDPGQFGLGWFFSTGYIERQSTMIGINDAITFSDQPQDDRFWLVMPEGSFEIVRDESWNDDWNGTWHTTKESGLIIESVGDLWEWDSFIVKTSGGGIYIFEPIEYSFTATETYEQGVLEPDLSGRPVKWMLTQIEDPHQNEVAFNYSSPYVYAQWSKWVLGDEREYHGVTTSSLDSIVLTQGEGPDYNVQQVVEIETQDRDDLEWYEDGGYFNYGDGTPSDDVYPQRIFAIKVYEPRADGEQGSLSYAFGLSYELLNGFGHPRANGDEEDDFVSVPRQALTLIRQYGNDAEESYPDFVAETTFKYSAYSWNDPYIPEDWHPNDGAHSYGISRLTLPTGETNIYQYQRINYPNFPDFEYPTDRWSAVVYRKESNSGIYEYDYMGKTVYNYDMISIFAGSTKRRIYNGRLGFTEVRETVSGTVSVPSITKVHKYYVRGNYYDILLGTDYNRDYTIEEEKGNLGGYYYFDRHCNPIAGIELESYVEDFSDFTKTEKHYTILPVNQQVGDTCIDDRTFNIRLSVSDSISQAEGSQIRVRTEKEYDQYNNITSIYNHGDLAVSGDETYTELTYWESTSNYIVNRWLTKDVYNNPPTLLPRTLLQKATQTWSEPGLLSNERQYYDFSQNLYLESSYLYDTTSNPTYNLTSKIEQGDRTKTYTYSTDIPYLVETETNTLNQVISTNTYYENGLLKSETDLNGNTTSHAYDKFGRIEAVWLPDDDGFDPDNIELGSADIRFSYHKDTDDYRVFYQTLKEQTQPDGDVYRTILAYDGYGNMVRRYSPFEDIRESGLNAEKTMLEEFLYGSGEKLVSYGPQIVSGFYDLGDWPDSIDWDDYERRTTYDKFHRPKFEYNYDITTNYSYGIETFDGILRHYKEVKEGEGSWRVTKYYFDAAGKEVAAVQFDSSEPENTTTTRYTRDILGNLTSIIEPEVNGQTSVTYLSYDDAGRLIETALPISSMEIGSYTNEMVYNSIGELAYKRSPNLKENSKWFKMSYDDLGRILEIALVTYSGDDPLTGAVGAPEETKFVYYYDSYPPGSSIINPPEATIEDHVFISSDLSNTLGRLTALEDGNATYLYYYDTRGNLIRVQREEDGETLNTDYYYNHAGQCEKMRYPSGDWVRMDHDELGSLYKIDSSIDGETRDIISQIDYNGAGLMTGLFYDNGAELSFGFEGARLETLEAMLPDANWCYYHLDSMEDITYKDNGWEVWDNIPGASLSLFNPNLENESLTPAQSFTDTEKAMKITFALDGNPPLQYLHGTVVSPLLDDAFYWPIAEYLEYDIMIQEDEYVGIGSMQMVWKMGFTRDDKGYFTNPIPLIPTQVTEQGVWYHVKIPVEDLYDPTWENFDWEDIKHLKFTRMYGQWPTDGVEGIYIDNVVMSFRHKVLNFIYDYDGHLIENITDISSSDQTQFSHLEHDYSFDERGQLTGYDRTDASRAGFIDPVSNYDYAYDNRGNRISYEETQWDYEGNSDSFDESLSYSPATNRINAQVVSISPAISFTLDSSGNVIESVRTTGTDTLTHSYDYDFGNRMTELTLNLNGDLFDFASLGAEYSADGIRTRRVLSENDGMAITSEDRRFVYDQWGHLISEYVVSGSDWELDREYINDANSAVCIVDFDDEGEPRYGFILKDHLGSTRLVVGDQVTMDTASIEYMELSDTSSKTEVFWTGDYEPFGRPIETAEPLNPDHYENPIRYTGYYYDGDVFEHYYAMARYYDPYLGRFLSRDPENFDPAGSPALINRYIYCTNNPLSYKDPSGRIAIALAALFGAFSWEFAVTFGVTEILANVVAGAISGGKHNLGEEGAMGGLITGVLSVGSDLLGVGLADWGGLNLLGLSEESLAVMGQINLANSAVSGAYGLMLSGSYGAAVTQGEYLGKTYREKSNWNWNHHGWFGMAASHVATALGNPFGVAVSQMAIFDDFLQHSVHVFGGNWGFQTPMHRDFENETMWVLAGGAVFLPFAPLGMLLGKVVFMGQHN